MIDTIGFDADDTLWDNEYLYRESKRRFIELLDKFRPASEAGKYLDEIEVGNLAYYGYGLKSFGLSMIEAALELSGGSIDDHILYELIGLVKEMLKAEVPVVDKAAQTLVTLAADFPLMLITKGDLFEQERKIERSGLAGYFKFIEVVGEKTERSYRRALGKYGIDPGRFLMVGNSLKSDILPILKLGGQAVYIPHEQTWHHENLEESDMEGRSYGQIERLQDLPAYLDGLLA